MIKAEDCPDVVPLRAVKEHMVPALYGVCILLAQCVINNMLRVEIVFRVESSLKKNHTKFLTLFDR